MGKNPFLHHFKEKGQVKEDIIEVFGSYK